MAIIGLILVPTLSPCATTLPVFLTAASSDDKSEFLVLAGLLWCSTLSVGARRALPKGCLLLSTFQISLRNLIG